MKNIFISSPFIDMQAERDLVQERVLPALREEARKYGDNVGVIDLRWGVDTSALESEEVATKVLKVCLDEIDRSHPYMLIFLGERYGTVMPREQIEKAVREREDKYTTDDYMKSITALEVEYGALSEKYGELEHCVVCFREPVVHMIDGAEKDLYAEHTQEGRRKLAVLKERIRGDLGNSERLITYSCSWDQSVRQLADFTANGQSLEKVLTNCFIDMFRDDWKEYENLSWQDKEQLGFCALMESKLRSFVGREVLLEEYYQSSVNGTCPIILQGEVGGGKTAIMCKLAERLQKEGKNVFTFFTGAGSMSANAESLVKQMVYYIENLLGVEEHFEDKDTDNSEIAEVTEKSFPSQEKGISYEDWLEQLQDLCSRLPKGERVYFCIDALDQLFPDEHVEKLDFFVMEKNVQVIASCTDTFVLPMESMVSREVKTIPALSKEDAKTVAKGILASYSRNAYAAMEEEILKKKSIGNPLYISLLIQRLNMMDMEELRNAMNETEIVALGVNIIREMPEETEDAIVAVIRNAVDKISEKGDALYEALRYLAVSRKGLRLWDLQGIFSAQKQTVATLDVSLLLKYLDSFFYVHEDDRIDFTHKVIRKGLLKELKNRETLEESLKEYLKTLDSEDGLRMREGMYFARIRRDEEFARALIEQAHNEKTEVLINTIMTEAIEDGGRFYCELIEKETMDRSTLCKFFLVSLPNQLGLTKEEMKVMMDITGALILCKEKVYEKFGSEGSLRELSISYDNMGRLLMILGQTAEALVYYEKGLKYSENLYEKSGSEKDLRGVMVSESYMGRGYLALGQANKALAYLTKTLMDKEKLYEKSGSENSLRELSIGYEDMGRAYLELRKAEEALEFFEKNLKIIEELYEKFGEEREQMALSNAFANIGRTYLICGKPEEALKYYGKEWKLSEESHMKLKSIKSLRELSISYNNMGQVLRDLDKPYEALAYLAKAVKCTEELHGKLESERSLLDLSISYNNIGRAYLDLGQAQEALYYYEKDLRCAEELYAMSGSERRFRDLAVSYDSMGQVLLALNQVHEALEYFQKSLECNLKLYERIGNEESLRGLSQAFNNIGQSLGDLGITEEAIRYFEKALRCAEEVHEKLNSERSLRELSVIYENTGYAYFSSGQTSEARVYYEKKLECAEKLHKKIGKKESLQKLLDSYEDVARLLLILGKSKEAMLYFEKIREYQDDIE